MNRTSWIIVIVVAIVVGGGAFWGGMTYAKSSTPTSRYAVGGTGAAAFAGRTGAAGFGGSASGGATTGTIIDAGNGSITIQLPSSTSTTAQTGTKLVLVGSQTQVEEMETVPASSLAVGQSVTVAGTTNSDGSVTATSVQVLPVGARRTTTTTTQ